MKSALGKLNLEFFQVIPADCLIKVDFYKTLLISFISPIITIILILSIYYGISYCKPKLEMFLLDTQNKV